MNEANWLNCTDPQPMLEFLRDGGRLSERKARLFAVACCRRIWHLLSEERSRSVVEVAERYADGAAGEEELSAAAIDVGTAGSFASEDAVVRAAEATAWLDPSAACHHAAFAASCNSRARQPGLAVGGRRPARVAARDAERAVRCGLLRDLFGNPFRAPPPVSPAWLAWQGGAVVKLAQAAYDERQLPSGHLDPHRLAVLADALEEAGCTHADIFSHFREPGVHVRACWVVDQLLGKE